LAKTKFEKLLLEAVDEAFDSLGNSAKQAIYFHLERIIRKIYEKTGKSFKWKENKEFLFQEYVAAARHSFLRERKRS